MKTLMQYAFLATLLVNTTFTMEDHTKHVVVPLEGFLFEVDAGRALAEMGSAGALSAAWTGGFRSSLKNLWNTTTGHAPDHKKIATRLFTVLNEIKYQPEVTPDPAPQVFWQGLEAPFILVHAWLQGNKKCDELQGIVLDHIQQDAGRMERASLESTAQIILNPTKNASTLKVQPKALDLLKALRTQGHTIHIVDNWNGEAFDALQEQHTVAFESINGYRHVSGHAHEVKSANNCTLHDNFFETHPDIPPANAVFIETEEQHTKPLVGKAFQHILYKDTTIEKLRTTLQKIGLLAN